MKLPKSTVAMRKPCLIYTTAVCSALLLTVPKITAQDPASTPPASDAANPAASDYVSRAEYDKLNAERNSAGWIARARDAGGSAQRGEASCRHHIGGSRDRRVASGSGNTEDTGKRNISRLDEIFARRLWDRWVHRPEWTGSIFRRRVQRPLSLEIDRPAF